MLLFNAQTILAQSPCDESELSFRDIIERCQEIVYFRMVCLHSYSKWLLKERDDKYCHWCMASENQLPPS